MRVGPRWTHQDQRADLHKRSYQDQFTFAENVFAIQQNSVPLSAITRKCLWHHHFRKRSEQGLLAALGLRPVAVNRLHQLPVLGMISAYRRRDEGVLGDGG
jgi:hypothetical protein